MLVTRDPGPRAGTLRGSEGIGGMDSPSGAFPLCRRRAWSLWNPRVSESRGPAAGSLLRDKSFPAQATGSAVDSQLVALL